MRTTSKQPDGKSALSVCDVHPPTRTPSDPTPHPHPPPTSPTPVTPMIIGRFLLNMLVYTTGILGLRSDNEGQRYL